MIPVTITAPGQVITVDFHDGAGRWLGCVWAAHHLIWLPHPGTAYWRVSQMALAPAEENTMRQPWPPEPGDRYPNDAALDAAGYASGLDVWDQVTKAYRNYLGDEDLANGQLRSLREAVRQELIAELPAPTVRLYLTEQVYDTGPVPPGVDYRAAVPRANWLTVTWDQPENGEPQP